MKLPKVKEVEAEKTLGGFPYPKTTRYTGMNATDSLAEAGLKVMLQQLAEVLAHEAGTRLGEDIEELHDMRVATRRLRAAFNIFSQAYKPKEVKQHLKGLRATGRALGRVRDLDVFIEKVISYQETRNNTGEPMPGLDPLIVYLRHERETARDKLFSHLDGEGYRKFMEDFNKFLHSGVPKKIPEGDEIPEPSHVYALAPILIYTRLSVVRSYQEIIEHATINQLHMLRIDIKLLRYTLEFFREVLGDEAKGLIELLKTVQDHLGELHDSDVACAWLTQFLNNWESQELSMTLTERRNPEPVVDYLAYRHAERHRLLISFPEMWRQLIHAEFRSDLARAISIL